MQALREITKDPAFPQGIKWRYRPVKTGVLVIQQGEPSRATYLIEKGMLQVTARVELAGGQQLQSGLSEIGPGEVFGEFSLFEDQPRTATVKAVTDALLIEFDSAALREYLDAHPVVGYKVTSLLFTNMVRRLSRSNERLAYLVSWGLASTEAGGEE